jgi:hypothetical protein
MLCWLKSDRVDTHSPIPGNNSISVAGGSGLSSYGAALIHMTEIGMLFAHVATGSVSAIANPANSLTNSYAIAEVGLAY